MDPQILPHSHSRLSLHKCIAIQQAIDVGVEETPPESPAESARMLRARRNAYALINAWFPPELMAAIFHEIVFSSQCIHQKSGHVTHSFGRQYTAISHVCQAWRTIAIGTPCLWTDISLASAEMAAAMLHRSNALPISIVFHSINDDEPTSAVSLALAHAKRASEIVLALCPVHMHNLISKYLTEPMPFLKRLVLCSYFEYPQTANPQCVLPRGYLEGASVLSDLRLVAIGILPGSILPATLTALSLVSPPGKLTVSQMIDLLDPLINLRDLCILGTLRSDASDTTKLSAIRRLSPRTRLVRLHLEALAYERWDFLSRFPVLPTTQMSLSCNAETLDDLHFGQILKPMYGEQGLVCGLSLSFLNRGCIDGYSTPARSRPQSQICFSLSVGRHDVFPRHEMLRDLCACMPLDSVETLFVGSAYDLGENIAPLLRAHLRGVRTLSLMNEAVKHVLRVMHPQVAEETSPAFPRLKVLSVCYEGYDSSAVEAHLSGPVADCLIARKESGVAAVLEELEINGEVVPSKYLEDLESLKSWKHRSSI